MKDRHGKSEKGEERQVNLVAKARDNEKVTGNGEETNSEEKLDD